MSGSHKKEREKAVSDVADHGWTVARETKRGYLIMRCSCGKHQETMHKTPDNPNHFTQKVAFMATTCSKKAPSSPAFLVGIESELSSKRPLSMDRVTDLIEVIVDHLDHLSPSPSVRSRQVKGRLVLAVEVVVEDSEQFDALTKGLALIRDALAAAGIIGAESLVVPTNLRPTVRPLQPA